MQAFFDLIAQTPLAEYLRGARWGYAGVNTAHVFSIALLVGAILTLDLKLIGVWRSEPLRPFARTLPQVGAAGLLLAVITGALMFSVRPDEYASNSLFQIKLALIVAGTIIALAGHRMKVLEQDAVARQRLLGIGSLSCWTGALICGRFVAYT